MLVSLIALSGLSTAAPAQTERSNTAPDDDEVIEIIEAPEGAGDGVISMRDGRALANFTVWLYDRLIQMADPTLELDEDAPQRAADLWAYMWPSLDPESKVLISQMDQIWPAAQANWEAADEEGKAVIAEHIRQLILAVWGDQVTSTASFLAGEISYEDYVPAMDDMMAGGGATAGEENRGGGNEGDNEEGPGDNGGGNDTGISIHDAVSTHLGNFIEYK